MDVRKPKERVKNGPYLALRLMRMGSNFVRELVRSRKVDEMVDGPGGNWLLPDLLRVNNMDLIRATMQKETKMRNQVSMVNKMEVIDTCRRLRYLFLEGY